MANDRPVNGANADNADEDLRMQVGPEDLLVDVDPQLPADFLKKAQAVSGKPPAKKAPRDTLVQTHNVHVKRQMGKPRATNLVKKPILSLAYPASYKSMYDLEKVWSHPAARERDATRAQWQLCVDVRAD